MDALKIIDDKIEKAEQDKVKLDSLIKALKMVKNELEKGEK